MAEMEVGRTFLALVVMGLGVLGALFPHVTWHLAQGRTLERRAPSHLTLFINRMGGTAVFVLGLWVLLVK
jgi:hypothetical protein